MLYTAAERTQYVMHYTVADITQYVTYYMLLIEHNTAHTLCCYQSEIRQVYTAANRAQTVMHYTAADRFIL